MEFVERYNVIIGILLGFVAGVIIPLILHIKNKSIKKLNFQLIANYSLAEKTLKEENLKIIYEGIEYETVRITILRFINEGNRPIDKDDFNNNLIICFHDENIKIINAGFLECDPKNLDIVFRKNENKIEFDPFLLNPTEFFEIKILSDRRSGFDVNARINGIKEVSLKIKKQSYIIKNWIVISGIIMALITISIWFSDNLSIKSIVYLTAVTCILWGANISFILYRNLKNNY